ncbi:CerR family C-terminal domain-containing protein [Rhodoferax saidenbachensis]|uniref:CerR family C-terminal domain-containing protein n=1 Tax=Rhodoferax saidenbachensis TaxID=1484693 RepID=UPI0004A29E4C|nr:CerR family C-terminal domain-containing protein [Rhodoferax saidenbachensis]
MPKTPSTSPTAKPLRSDGQEARNRLLDAALTLFADKGFAKTSTREIAQAAQANIASISYYFGDKDGLYRAVFADPRYNPPFAPPDDNAAPLDIRSTLTLMLRTFVEPLKTGQQIRQCMKLHFREMIEPTGMWQAEIDDNIKPAHEALVLALCRHLGVKKPDDDMHHLAFDIAGLGVMLHVGIDVIQAIRPALLGSATALDRYHARMVDSAMALSTMRAWYRSSAVAEPSSAGRMA